MQKIASIRKACMYVGMASVVMGCTTTQMAIDTARKIDQIKIEVSNTPKDTAGYKDLMRQQNTLGEKESSEILESILLMVPAALGAAGLTIFRKRNIGMVPS